MIRDIQNIDDDIIYEKRKIKEVLYQDPDVIEALHNPDLDPSEPDTYINKNIFDYIRIPGTTTDVSNFICFDIKQASRVEKNDHMKNQNFIFMIFCQAQDIDTSYGMSRHDLLGYLIRDLFNYSNMFGTQLVEESNVPGIAENNYSTRTITFNAITHNSLQRAVRTNKYEFPG